MASYRASIYSLDSSDFSNMKISDRKKALVDMHLRMGAADYSIFRYLPVL